MKGMKNLIILCLLLSSLTALASTPVGYYNQGSLIDGECMPEEGDGFVQLYRAVGHYWGTTEMIDMLERTASDMARRYPNRDRMQIEDISARDGGDIDPHGSHENGLDVDIQYFKADGRESDERLGYAKPMVNNGSVSSNFDVERNWEMVKALHRNGRVQMIFMDQKLQDALISYARSKNEYGSHLKEIQSLRHVANHQDHLHVRLLCPPTAKGCFSRTKKR